MLHNMKRLILYRLNASHNNGKRNIISVITFGSQCCRKPQQGIQNTLKEGKFLFTIFVLLISNVFNCYSQDGVMDNTFGEQGVVNSEIEGDFEIATDMIIDSEGAIYITGSERSVTSNLIISKILEDGAPDINFGLNGVVAIPGNDSIFSRIGGAIELLESGKIVVGGCANGWPNSYGCLYQFLPDGTIDTLFGTNGCAVLYSGNYDSDNINSIAIQKDGKILFCGYSYNETYTHSFIVGRALQNGILDTSFGDNGLIITNFSGGNSVAKSIKIMSDGKLLVAGISDGKFIFYKLHPDGEPDYSFGNAGVAFVEFSDTVLLSGFDILSTGQIIAVGTMVIENPAYCQYSRRKIAMAMLQKDGTLDLSFSDKGTLLYNFNSCTDRADNVLVQPDDKILVCGNTGEASLLDPTHLFAMRLLPTGDLDTIFGEQGTFQMEQDEFNNTSVAIGFQPTGKAIIAGTSVDNINSKSNFFLTRINTGVAPEDLIPAPSENKNASIYISENIIYLYPAIYPCEFYLFDLQGKTIVHSTINSSTASIYLNELTEGIYFGVLKMNNTIQTAKLFVEPRR